MDRPIIEVLTEAEIRDRQEGLLARHPSIKNIKPRDRYSSVYDVPNWQDFSVDEISAVEEMTRLEWLAGGDGWDWVEN